MRSNNVKGNGWHSNAIDFKCHRRLSMVFQRMQTRAKASMRTLH